MSRFLDSKEESPESLYPGILDSKNVKIHILNILIFFGVWIPRFQERVPQHLRILEPWISNIENEHRLILSGSGIQDSKKESSKILES